MNVFAFHLTSDLKTMVNRHLYKMGVYNSVLTTKVKDFCTCGGWMSLNQESLKTPDKFGYVNYELTCCSCGRVKTAKLYVGNKIPKHFLWIK